MVRKYIHLTFLGPCIVNVFLSMTNKMQRCIMLFLIVVFPCMLTIIQLLFQQNALVFYY
jgi:hypothetical protein